MANLIYVANMISSLEVPNWLPRQFRSGLIDECHLFVVPIIVGGGKSALPEYMRLELELLEERRFENG